MLNNLVRIASFPALLLAARFIPFDRLPSTCIFYRLTGYPCPSCGITRSVMALVRFDLDVATRMNPLGVPFIGIFGLWWAIVVYQIATGRRTWLARWAGSNLAWLAAIGGVILFLYGAIRIWLLAR